MPATAQAQPVLADLRKTNKVGHLEIPSSDASCLLGFFPLTDRRPVPLYVLEDFDPTKGEQEFNKEGFIHEVVFVEWSRDGGRLDVLCRRKDSERLVIIAYDPSQDGRWATVWEADPP